MPTYNYQCQQCLEQTEKRQKIDEAPFTNCDSCKGEGTMRRLISSCGFILAGGGWYKDGYHPSNRS